MTAPGFDGGGAGASGLSHGTGATTTAGKELRDGSARIGGLAKIVESTVQQLGQDGWKAKSSVRFVQAMAQWRANTDKLLRNVGNLADTLDAYNKRLVHAQQGTGQNVGKLETQMNGADYGSRMR
jgi:uncharacterized protein YukE